MHRPRRGRVEREILEVVHADLLQLLAHFGRLALAIRQNRVDVVVRDSGCQ